MVKPEDMSLEELCEVLERPESHLLMIEAAKRLRQLNKELDELKFVMEKLYK